MRCPRHHHNEVSGYCSICGDFGCDECMHQHEGKIVCEKCYRPISARLARERQHQQHVARRERQRLVIHDKNGDTFRGVCFALNVASEGLHLELVDDSGATMDESRYFPFESLKAVFFVKSFDGNFDQRQRFRDLHDRGEAVVVEFHDGEIMQGNLAAGNRRDAVRFFLMPEDARSNNLSVLVERKAVAAVYTAKEYVAKSDSEVEQYLRQHREESDCAEELRGDFHFEKQEYVRALKHYKMARREFPDRRRIVRKIAATQFNTGVMHVKRHEYNRALACMKLVLEADPTHERALKMEAKLSKALHKRSKKEKDAAPSL